MRSLVPCLLLAVAGCQLAPPRSSPSGVAHASTGQPSAGVSSVVEQGQARAARNGAEEEVDENATEMRQILDNQGMNPDGTPKTFKAEDVKIE